MPLADTLIITSYPPHWESLAQVTCETHYRYAQRWGYDYHADRSDLQDDYFDPHLQKRDRLGIAGFVKLDLFLHWLPKYKQVVWIDADALVTNVEIPLRDLWPNEWNFNPVPHPAHVVVPYDHNGHNATVIMVRSSDLAWDFLWSCNNSGRKLFLRHDWKEMEAMRYFAMTPPYDTILHYESVKKLCGILPNEYAPYLPLRVSEKYGWKPGDWVLHLSALHIEKRVELARKYAEELCLT